MPSQPAPFLHCYSTASQPLTLCAGPERPLVEQTHKACGLKGAHVLHARRGKARTPRLAASSRAAQGLSLPRGGLSPGHLACHHGSKTYTSWLPATPSSSVFGVLEALC